ncbi:hypothetical protein LPN01_16575 [Sphingomonas sp. A2-49]|uniref:hypothetical protein n=1 Tax=Sphingomonas sp. A2-49 TaxID=1391375 RepID=UPI0021D3D8C7|nr:hypothetical protein [Sphingomonas sp. A2-49]MCU6455696.1 hypothetical protein [Sphingomonas sp. A2-49]
MTDKQPMQAMSTDHDGARDGVGDAPAKQGGGESGGGAYPNPHTGKGKQDDVGGGFTGHGGQSHVAYSGPGDGETGDDGGNENAVTQ